MNNADERGIHDSTESEGRLEEGLVVRVNLQPVTRNPQSTIPRPTIFIRSCSSTDFKSVLPSARLETGTGREGCNLHPVCRNTGWEIWLPIHARTHVRACALSPRRHPGGRTFQSGVVGDSHADPLHVPDPITKSGIRDNEVETRERVVRTSTTSEGPSVWTDPARKPSIVRNRMDRKGK